MSTKRSHSLKVVICLAVTLVDSVKSGKAADVNGAEVVDGSGGGSIATPWAVTGNLFIGNAADGHLTVQNAGEVTATGGAFLGFSASRSGRLTVTGSGSTLSFSNILYGGWSGTGVFEVLDGGTVSNFGGYIGYSGYATANVDGVGSTWAITSDLIVGGGATGDLTVANGGLVTSASVVLGYDAAATGTVTVDGIGSRMLVGGDLDIGSGGTGVLRITDGGAIESGWATVGYDVGSQGTIELQGTGSRWSIDGDLTIGYEGTGEVTLGAGAELSVDDGFGYITLGSEVGAEGKLNVGSAVGASASAAGSLDAWELDFGSGSGELVFNHTNVNYDFSLDLTGAGTIRHVAGTTFLTGDISGFSGTTIVSGGLLSTDNHLAGSLLVDDGGTIGGTGTYSNMVLNSGATVAPGNSIGTLNVTGGLDFVSGTSYEVEVDANGNSDLLVASGAINIDNGANLSVLAENGTDTGATYQSSTTYTILQGASLSGSFGTVTEDFAYLDASVSYDATTAYLTLVRADDLLFQARANTANQRSVAAAINSQGSGTLFDAILVLPEGAPPAAFDALSGEIHGAVTTDMLNRASLLGDLLLGRVSAFSDLADAYPSHTVFGYQPFDPILRTSHDSGIAVWTAALGSVGQVDGDGNSHGHSAANGGVLIGIDKHFSDGWHGGLATGYESSTVRQNALHSEASAESLHLAAYGGRRLGPLNIAFGVAGTWSDVDTERQVEFSGFSDELEAAYRATVGQAYLEVGWTDHRDLWEIEPFGRVAFSHVRQADHSEVGGPAALEIGSQNFNQWAGTLGVRVDRVIALNKMLGKLRAEIGWRHAFGSVDNRTQMRFLSSGEEFTIAAVDAAKNEAHLRLGVQLDLTSLTSLELAYKGSISSTSSAHSMNASFKKLF